MSKYDPIITENGVIELSELDDKEVKEFLKKALDTFKPKLIEDLKDHVSDLK